jgi:2-dehydro-3-deoxyphosphooctonate aldolase (KDO 8-P synthase)
MNFAMSTGADGIFVEVHPDPPNSLSDSESILKLEKLGPFLKNASRIRDAYESI